MLYVTAMLRPIMPVLNYYIDYDYIVAELCENKSKPELKCNGKCHLAKEIKKANNGVDNQEKVPPLNMNDYPFAPLPLHTFTLQKNIFIQENQVRDTYLNTFNSLFFNTVFQPPKRSC